MASSTKDPMKSTSKPSSFNVETLSLNSKLITSSSYPRMKVGVKGKKIMIEMGDASDMKHKIDIKYEDATVESMPDASIKI